MLLPESYRTTQSAMRQGSPILRPSKYARAIVALAIFAACVSGGRANAAGPGSVSPPKAQKAEVDYPPGGNGEADVLLDITVGADGSVTDVVLVSGKDPFAAAALAAAWSWRFDPASRGGRPVAARIRYALRFTPPPPPEEPDGSAEAASAEGPVEPARTPAVASAPLSVTVRGERSPGGSVRLTRTEARNLPGSFGDPLRAIEAQPGIVPIVSGLPTFFIRGAPPANVGFFIDGVDVPLLYHAFFGPSVLHPSVIESVDLYRGAAPIEYGRFGGPVVAANLTPLEPRWGGEASLRAIDAGALVRAPFGGCDRGDEPDCARGTARVSGRYSYTGLVLSLLTDAKLDYWDYQGQVSYALGPRDTVSVLGFGAYDFFFAGGDTEAQGGGRVQFHRADVRYDHRFESGGSLRVAVTGGYDRTGGADETVSAVTDHSLRMRARLTFPLVPTVTLESGIDGRVDRYGLESNATLLSYPDYLTLFPERTETSSGVYAAAVWKPVSGVAVTPAVRADLYTERQIKTIGLDPRIAASFAAGSDVTIEHSFGLAHQRPNFAADIPGAQVADLEGGLQEAWLWSSGVTWKVPEFVTLSASVFQSTYFHALDPIGGGRDFDIDRTVLDRRSTIVAKGLELGISRSLARRFGGFIGYTLSRSQQTNGKTSQVSGFDRPHVLQAALSYEIAWGLRAGTRAILYSGVPELNYEGSPHFTTARRGTPYFRVDARLEKRWRIGTTGWFAASAEILNATSTKEAVRLDCGAVCVERFAGPVILPNVGVEAGF
jgi:TonB family protein